MKNAAKRVFSCKNRFRYSRKRARFCRNFAKNWQRPYGWATGPAPARRTVARTRRFPSVRVAPRGSGELSFARCRASGPKFPAPELGERSSVAVLFQALFLGGRFELPPPQERPPRARTPASSAERRTDLQRMTDMHFAHRQEVSQQQKSRRKTKKNNNERKLSETRKRTKSNCRKGISCL